MRVIGPDREIPKDEYVMRRKTMSNNVEKNELKTVYKFSALTAAALLAASTAIALVGAAISS